MSEPKSLRRVRLTYDVVVASVDDEDARREAHRAIEKTTATLIPAASDVTLLLSEEDIPEGWSEASLPFGDLSKKPIAEWLARRIEVVLTGPSREVAKLLGELKLFAASRPVKIVVDGQEVSK